MILWMGHNSRLGRCSRLYDAREDKRLEEIPMDDEHEQFQQDVLASAHQMTSGETLQVVPNQGQLPSMAVLMGEDDVVLIHKARERLAAPQRVKVSMDDL